MESQKQAWETAYKRQDRPWRGTTDISWTDIRPGMRVLDLGCGNGKTTDALLDAGAAVCGIDFSVSAVESCKRRFGNKAALTVGDVRELPYETGYFDALTAVHILDNLGDGDIGTAAHEWTRVLRPGGRLYLLCFSEGDLRSGGTKESFRNGIRYHYYSERELRDIFAEMDCISLETISERTRFGGDRVRIRCIFEKKSRNERISASRYRPIYEKANLPKNFRSAIPLDRYRMQAAENGKIHPGHPGIGFADLSGH